MITYLKKKEDFEKLIEKNILVDFYAEWCAPCQMLGEELKQLDYEILKIDVDKFKNLAIKYNVMSVPTLIHFNKSKNIKQNIGFMSKDELKMFMEDK